MNESRADSWVKNSWSGTYQSEDGHDSREDSWVKNSMSGTYQSEDWDALWDANNSKNEGNFHRVEII